MGLLIDSTLLIRAESNRLAPDQLVSEILDRFGDTDLSISAMSAGELLHGCWMADTPSRRARREEFVEAVLSALPVVPIMLPVMRVYAQVGAELRAEGAPIPTSDLLIASTALSRGDELATGNVRHFRRIPGLTVHEFV